MIREAIERTLGSILPPPHSQFCEKFLEELRRGKRPDIGNLGPKSKVDLYGRDLEGNEVMLIRTPGIGTENRDYFVTIDQGGVINVEDLSIPRKLP